MNKTYYGVVKIEWGTSFEANDKKDFVVKLKEHFRQEFNIELQDKEINNIQINK